MHWRFVCPVCGNVASLADFHKYKDKGATPDSATKECIGRYVDGPIYRGLGHNEPDAPKRPCDYAAYGLIDCTTLTVLGPDKDVKRSCFEFAEPEVSELCALKAKHEELKKLTAEFYAFAVCSSRCGANFADSEDESWLNMKAKLLEAIKI